MPTWIWAVLAFFSLLFALKLVYVVCTGWSMPVTRGALFVPTHRLRIEAFLDAVPMRADELLVDLGCGDGRVLRAVRRRYGARARGVDVNPLACWIARLRNLGDRQVRVERGDFWTHDLGDADVIFCYLFPDLMKRLARKIEAEAAPGTRVVCCNFPLPGRPPMKVLRPASSSHGDPIFLYRVTGDRKPIPRKPLKAGNPGVILSPRNSGRRP